ncbi:MAG: hypothetical protein WC753_00025 [Candidatus Gracilibacteria bacterium]
MPSLFIDTLSAPASICLFDESRNIIDTLSWSGKHVEFDTTIESIDLLLKRHNLSYSELQSIVCLVGPGGFTGIRVTTLIANTLGYSFKIPLYSVTVDDFFRFQDAPTPWILPLTKTEVLTWDTPKNTRPDIKKIDTLHDISQYSSNQESSLLQESIPYKQANNYSLFLQNIPLRDPVTILHPLYARDPNILRRK